MTEISKMTDAQANWDILSNYSHTIQAPNVLILIILSFVSTPIESGSTFPRPHFCHPFRILSFKTHYQLISNLIWSTLLKHDITGTWLQGFHSAPSFSLFPSLPRRVFSTVLITCSLWLLRKRWQTAAYWNSSMFSCSLTRIPLPHRLLGALPLAADYLPLIAYGEQHLRAVFLLLLLRSLHLHSMMTAVCVSIVWLLEIRQAITGSGGVGSICSVTWRNRQEYYIKSVLCLAIKNFKHTVRNRKALGGRWWDLTGCTFCSLTDP